MAKPRKCEEMSNLAGMSGWVNFERRNDRVELKTPGPFVGNGKFTLPSTKIQTMTPSRKLGIENKLEHFSTEVLHAVLSIYRCRCASEQLVSQILLFLAVARPGTE